MKPVALSAFAQEPKPSCNNCSTTFISNEQFQACVKLAPSRIISNDVSDQQVRALDIGKINVDIGIV